MEERIPVPHGTRILRGALSGFLLNILAFGFLFVGLIIIPRVLSRTDYAEFTVSLSFVVLVSLVADLGLLPMHTRLFAECIEDVAQGRGDRRGSLFGSVLALRVTLSCFASALVLIIAPLIYGHEMVLNMAILLPSLFISSRILIVRAVGESLLRGRGLYHIASLFVLVDSITLVIGLIAQSHPSLQDIMWIYSLSGLPGFLLMVAYISKWLIAEKIRVSIDLRLIARMLRMAIPLSFAAAFFAVFNEGDKLLLDKLSSHLEVSNFGAVIRISTGLAILPIVLGAVLSPELTRLLVRKDYVRAQQLTDLATRLLLIVGGGIALVVSELSQNVIPILLSQKYASAAPAFEWIGWLMIPFFLASFIAELTMAAGLFRTTMFYTAILMCFGIGSDLILIPQWGATGAAISRLAAVTLGLGFLIWTMWNASFIDMSRLCRTIFRLGGAVIPSMGLGMVLKLYMGNNWFVAASEIGMFILAVHYLRLMPLKDIIDLMNRIIPRKNVPGFGRKIRT